MTSIDHPSHTVPDEIAESMHGLRQHRLELLDRQQRNAALSRPTAAERDAMRELADVDDERLRRHSDLTRQRLDRILETLRDEPAARVRIWRNVELLTLERAPPPPPPVDHSFWWAKTDWSVPLQGAAWFSGDGLHFTGGPTHHDGDLFFTSFGATAIFELQPARVPRSSTGLWLSSPHIELHGAMMGYTGRPDILSGDLWSKCWMHRRQTVLQFASDPGRPPVVLGNGEENDVVIFEENAERLVHVGMPGFKPMPAVTFGNVNPSNSVWVQLEVRFNVQLEGAGTFVWMDPEVLLRTFQWPLAPISG
jgi:hypothetical protein